MVPKNKILEAGKVQRQDSESRYNRARFGFTRVGQMNLRQIFSKADKYQVCG